MVNISSWADAEPHIQGFLDTISQYGSCKLLCLGGVGFFYYANQKGKDEVLQKRPSTDDADYAWVDGMDTFELSENLGTPLQLSGICYKDEDPSNIHHEVIDPTYLSGEDTLEYKATEQNIIDGKLKPIMASKNGKVELYFDLFTWIVNKHKSGREKDLRDLELLEEIGY